MSRQRRSKPSQGSGRHRTRARLFPWWITVVALLIVGAGGAWLAFRGGGSGGPSPSASGLPGPAGGRDVAQDVNTMIGQAAPPFTLPTAEGRTYEVRPGQGRPTVLIFHMGIA